MGQAGRSEILAGQRDRSTFLTISPTATSVEVLNSANGCGPTTYEGQGVRFTSRLNVPLTILGTITHQQHRVRGDGDLRIPLDVCCTSNCFAGAPPAVR